MGNIGILGTFPISWKIWRISGLKCHKNAKFPRGGGVSNKTFQILEFQRTKNGRPSSQDAYLNIIIQLIFYSIKWLIHLTLFSAGRSDLTLSGF